MTTKDPTREQWPSEIRLNAEKNTLNVVFTGGIAGSLPAEMLRVMSQSAEVQGHSAAERRLVSGKSTVTIRAVEPIGNYAVRLVFSDGHNTGIYSWAYLYDLILRKDELWNGYLNELAAAGLSRNR